MSAESKKISQLQKAYDKIRVYCMMNFAYKNNDGSAFVYDNVLKQIDRLIKEIKEYDDKIRRKRATYINKIEKLSAQGFSSNHIKNMNRSEEIEKNKQKQKKDYMDKIIYEGYYKRKEDDRDFGGELDIWGKSTKEFKFITKLGVKNPYIELQQINQKEDVALSVGDIFQLVDSVLIVFEKQKDKNMLKTDLINTFNVYGIDLL